MKNPVTRPERNEFVLRLAVKLAVCGHLVFAIIWPLLDGDRSAKVWAVSTFFGERLVASVAALIALIIIAAIWLKSLRIPGGILYMAFCGTYAVLVGDLRVSLFAACMSVCGLALAWSGVPDE